MPFVPATFFGPTGLEPSDPPKPQDVQGATVKDGVITMGRKEFMETYAKFLTKIAQDMIEKTLSEGCIGFTKTMVGSQWSPLLNPQAKCFATLKEAEDFYKAMKNDKKDPVLFAYQFDPKPGVKPSDIRDQNGNLDPKKINDPL